MTPADSVVFPDFHVGRLNIPAIRDSALALAAVGRKMPPADANEGVVGLWLIQASFALVRLERLLNPAKLEFADRRRFWFFGPEPAHDLEYLRDSIDRILLALEFEEVAHLDYPCGTHGESLQQPTARFPSAEGLGRIQMTEWDRVEKLALALQVEQTPNTATAMHVTPDEMNVLKAMHVTPDEMNVLKAMHVKHPETVTQEQLAGTQLVEPRVCLPSVRTVAKYLNHLKEMGLVHQPCGPKKGFGLTEQGTAFLTCR